MESGETLELIQRYFGLVLDNSIGVLLSPGHFLSVLPLAVAFAIGFIVLSARLSRRRSKRSASSAGGARWLMRALFPARVFWHRSARLDYGLFLINNGLLFFLTATAVLSASLVTVSIVTIAEGLGFAQGPANGPGFLLSALFSLFLLLVWDFAATYAHYLKHRVPLLWEFHKVHHSAEVMTPVTALRRHPVDALFGGFVTILFIGAAVAIWTLLVGTGVQPVMLFGQVAGIYLWRLLGYNLRHSHVWISYGPFWNRILISPAQHQIHHSVRPVHYDKNFGHIFAFWDRMFGTLYLPDADERVRFGLDASEMKDFRSLKDLYFKPVLKVGRSIRRRRPT